LLALSIPHPAYWWHPRGAWNAMQNAAISLGDEDEPEDSLASERAGDRAREDGELLLALVHYRKAAELRAGDSALVAKIAETASARVAAGHRHRRPVGSQPRWPSSPILVTLIAAAILTFGVVLTTQAGKPSRESPKDRMARAAAAPAAIESASMTTVGSPMCLAETIEAAEPGGPLAATKVSPNAEERERGHGARLGHSRRARSRHHKPGKRLSARSKNHSRSHDGDEAKRRLSPLIET
jgi:hypothetical protein